MLFMKSQSHIWPFFRSHYLIKKKKKLVYCNVFGMVSPSVFGINFFFFLKKKTLNWTHGAKLDNNWNSI